MRFTAVDSSADIRVRGPQMALAVLAVVDVDLADGHVVLEPGNLEGRSSSTLADTISAARPNHVPRGQFHVPEDVLLVVSVREQRGDSSGNQKHRDSELVHATRPDPPSPDLGHPVHDAEVPLKFEGVNDRLEGGPLRSRQLLVALRAPRKPLAHEVLINQPGRVSRQVQIRAGNAGRSSGRRLGISDGCWCVDHRRDQPDKCDMLSQNRTPLLPAGRMRPRHLTRTDQRSIPAPPTDPGTAVYGGQSSTGVRSRIADWASSSCSVAIAGRLFAAAAGRPSGQERPSATPGAVVRGDDPPDDTRILRLKPEHVVRLATRLLANAERFRGLNREDDEAHLHPLPPPAAVSRYISAASAARLQQPGGRLDRVSI